MIFTAQLKTSPQSYKTELAYWALKNPAQESTFRLGLSFILCNAY